jgi:hypothetical protein
MNITAYPNDSSGIEHRIYTRFGVVTHYKATELQSGFLKTARTVIPKLYRRIIVF